MSDEEIFESAINQNGDLGAVFERADGTCYFYLCKIKDGKPDGVMDTIHVTSKKPDFGQKDIEVKWNHSGEKVGFLVKGKLVAFFDTKTKSKHGENMTPIIPEIVESFGV